MNTSTYVRALKPYIALVRRPRYKFWFLDINLGTDEEEQRFKRSGLLFLYICFRAGKKNNKKCCWKKQGTVNLYQKYIRWCCWKLVSTRVCYRRNLTLRHDLNLKKTCKALSLLPLITDADGAPLFTNAEQVGCLLLIFSQAGKCSMFGMEAVFFYFSVFQCLPVMYCSTLT